MILSIITAILCFTLVNAADIAQENIEAIPSKPCPFSYNFESHSCPKKLSTAVSNAIDSATYSGNLPLLFCDLDETLVEKWLNGVVATEFYHNLRDSGVISRAHGIFILTSRLIAYRDTLSVTNSDLETCNPEFATRMRSITNMNGLIPLNLYTRFLHDYGLIIMGNSVLIKRQALGMYCLSILTDRSKKTMS